MAKGSGLACLMLFAATTARLACQSMELPTIGFGVAGGPSVPIGANAPYYSSGFSADLSCDYRLPALRGLGLALDVGYGLLPLVAGPALGFGRAELGASYSLPLGKAWALEAFAMGGGFIGTFSDTADYPEFATTTAGGAALSAGLALGFIGIPGFSIQLGARYRGLLGLYDGIEGGLSASYSFEIKPQSRGTTGPRIVPLSSSPLAVDKVELGNVFPVFFKYYKDHPIGSVTLRNSSKKPITDINATFHLKQYMDAPQVVATIPVLEPGSSARLEVRALFTERMLDITEGTMVAADMALTFTQDGQVYQTSDSQAVRILDRNAMDWSDDRHPAAFVTAKDPAVLSFAKNTVGSIKDTVSAAIDRNFQSALALHEALDLHGLVYVVDPKSAYTTNSLNPATVDFLQFPRQTLEYKSGDCDDLSILFAALLESVGIESAFITVPGHIYVAFGLDQDAASARKSFARPEDLVLLGDRAWVPVEITDRKGGFLAAWQEGAREWREAEARGLARLYPVHEAWSTYEPVGLPGNPLPVNPPSGDAILEDYRAELGLFVDQELSPQVARLEAEIAGGRNPAKSLNNLGALYARYGNLDKAEKQFVAAIARQDYPPALINLGNLYYLKKDLGKARGYFERAYAQGKDPLSQLGLARVSHDQADYAATKRYFDELRKADPALAEKFAYLDLTDKDATRAADVVQEGEAVVWAE